jgi:TolB protein
MMRTLIKAVFPVLVFLLLLQGRPEAKIYIDISNPERRIPIAISPLDGIMGADISSVVSADLEFTGLFLPFDPKGFTEAPQEPFRRENWLSMGVACVAKGKTVLSGTVLEATVSLYDVETGKALYTRRYSADRALTRPIAHVIADDIYKELTGHDGVFRSRLAVIMQRNGVKDIYLADWDGQRARPVGLKEKYLISLRWSRDGSRLYYSSQRGRRWGIFALELKTLRETLLFSKPGTNIMGDVDANGDIVFSASFQGSPGIYMLSPGLKLRTLISTWGIDVSPSFSPDGSRIVFVSNRGGTPQIYIMDSNGYNIARISFKGAYNTSPSWSPGGERIVFAGRYGGNNQIFTAKPDGSDSVMLTTAGSNDEPSFSADGRFIAFTSDRDGYQAAYIMRANGEGQKRISPPGVTAMWPRWSLNK